MRTLACIGLLACCAGQLIAADWPQYKGPNRDDISTETGLLRSWPAAGPPLVWQYDHAGAGLSGPAIVGDQLFLTGGRDEDEVLYSLRLPGSMAEAPRELWSVPLGATFDFPSNNWSRGPSATPTVDGDRVYALGGRGQLVCARSSTGQVVWSRDLPTELAAEVNPIGGGPRNLGWGFTWSPLVDGDRLICLPGGPLGTVAALDKLTGDVIWRSVNLKYRAAYASPVLAEIGGMRQYVLLTNEGVYGVAAADGKLLWGWDRPGRYGTEVVNSPLVRGDLVYVTVGAGGGCDLLRISKSDDGFSAEPVYRNSNLANHHGNVILIGDHVYGFGRGWSCQNIESGELVWTERRRLRGGSMVAAAGQLYLLGEDEGEVVLIDASPVGWTEHGRFKVAAKSTLRKPRGGLWTPPVIAHGRLYLRDQELLWCYDITDREAKNNQ